MNPRHPMKPQQVWEPIWYCGLHKSWVHACRACWVSRFLFTIMVVVPVATLLFRHFR